MRRLDFQWKGQLNSEQFQAKYTKEVNRVLLENILPKHVGMYVWQSLDIFCVLALFFVIVGLLSGLLALNSKSLLVYPITISIYYLVI